jgi:dTDP-4-amino-4,6-dideoxygalactose transaminase
LTAPWKVRLAGPSFPALDLDALSRLLESGWLTNGPQVQAFETAFAALQGVEHAVALSSCTAALHLALIAHGVGPGDEVITSPMTFAATCNVILQVGARPVLVDIDPTTMNFDTALVAEAITQRTKAVIAVHFAGLPVDLAPLMALKAQHGFALIHDAAHATEARYDNTSMAAMGDTACYSFYATKNLPIGEGGMLATNDRAVAEKARVLRSHGMSKDAFIRHGDQHERWQHWDMLQPGFNYKMTELAAMLGCGQIAHLADGLGRRGELVARYEQRLGGVEGLLLSASDARSVHAHHLMVVRIIADDVERDVLLPQLRAHGIEASIHYRAIADLTWYRETFGWSEKDFPHAIAAGRQCITLPLHSQMTLADVDLVADTLIALLARPGHEADHQSGAAGIGPG